MPKGHDAMNDERLILALTAHDAAPEAVMASLRPRMRRRRRVRQVIVGAAVAGIAVSVIALVNTSRSSNAPSIGTVSPPAGSDASGCADIPLGEALSTARRAGASIVVAKGVLTGKTVREGEILHQMVLSSPRTISGPLISAGATAWVSGATGPSGPIPGTDSGALWGPDGHLFAIVWPKTAANGPVGPTLQIAPVVDGQVIFSTAGCWSVSGLSTRPFSGPLAEIPGSQSYERALRWGLFGVPLTTVENLAR
jgi:hypothetical protein